MLDIAFFTKDSTCYNYSIPEKAYERLALSGFSKIRQETKKHLIIEEQEGDYYVIELDRNTRQKFKRYIEKERHEELKKEFTILDNNPTIKEVRYGFEYVKVLTELYDLIATTKNVYLCLDI